jgi:hypothetical protein
LGFPLGVGFSFGDKIPFCALEWVMKKKEKELGPASGSAHVHAGSGRTPGVAQGSGNRVGSGRVK